MPSSGVSSASTNSLYSNHRYEPGFTFNGVRRTLHLFTLNVGSYLPSSSGKSSVQPEVFLRRVRDGSALDFSAPEKASEI